MFFAAVVAALVVGFLIGLLSFKIKARWCPMCGTTTLTYQEHQRRAEAR